jgi:serine/threonine protein phosphatase PrpC
MTIDQHAKTAELPVTKTRTEPLNTKSALARVDIAALSHPGRVRPDNEDHYLVVKFGRSLDVLMTNLPEGAAPARAEEVGYGLIVADGMGGVKGGEMASRLAINTLIDLVLEVPDWILQFDLDDVHAQRAMRRSARRYRQVSDKISQQAKREPQLAGMGTTMTAAASLGENLIVTHVGDSRAYLFREGKLIQLTRDQTVVQALLDMGQITQEGAAAHPWRHILTQALGKPGSDLQVESRQLKLDDGDCLLLCTDGLTEMVPDANIVEVLGRGETARDTCCALLNLALERGGKDNVTVIVARYRLPD